MERLSTTDPKESQARLLEHVRRNPEATRRHFLEQGRLASQDGFVTVASDFALPCAPIMVSEQLCYQTLDHLRRLVDLMGAVPRLFFQNDRRRMHEHYRVPERLARFLGDPEQVVVPRFARPDGVVVDGVFKVVETNIETGIGGVHELDVLCRMHRGAPAVRELLRDRKVRSRSPADAFTRFFVEDGRSWTYWDIDSRPDEEFLVDMAVAMIDRMRAAGARVCLATSREIGTRGGKLMAGDRPVDRLFRGFAAMHLDRCPDEIAGVAERVHRLDDVLEGHLGCLLVESKLNLALVSDPSNHHLLSEDQVSLVETVVPWTRQILDVETLLPGSERGSLIGYLDRAKDSVVIKRGTSFRGYDTLVGKEASSKRWREAVRHALDEGCWIAQELLTSDPIPLPYIVDGTFEEYTPRTTFAFFLIGDRLGGGGARTSLPGGSIALTEPEVNCGITPAFSC